MNFLQKPTEQEFIDYVNKTPKKVLFSSADVCTSDDVDMSVVDFVALCQRKLGEMRPDLRNAARVLIDDDRIEFRAHREETNDEHIARCREQFDAAWHAKNNRFLQYQLLKREFGDA